MTTHTLPDRETMVRAFLQRDSTFEGLFYTGVRTTGIFCRPTCGAKKPLPKNVVFFATTRDALANGFRPCRMCRPMSAPEDPPWVRSLIRELEHADGHVLRDATLRELGHEPARARRWFKQHHGITFQAFARHLRIARAYGAIRNDSHVPDAAFDYGYESLSGFGATFRKSTGFAPSASRSASLILVTRIPTPLGPMVAGAADGRMVLLEFADRPMLETQLARVEKAFGARTMGGSNPVFDWLHRELDDYFAGRLTSFTVPIETRGTPFQESVWSVLREIPYGESRSYAEQATAIGRPTAVRAVARANGDNRIAIIVPCHRVLGSNGSLTGYGGGLWRKRYLLELERGAAASVV